MVNAQITDGQGAGHKAKVTNAGQLVVAPIHYSSSQFVNLAVNGQGYTFYEPKADCKFVITDIIAIADRNVTTDCVIDIYEADDLNSATIGKSIFQLDMLKNTTIVMNGLNIIMSSTGVFVNAKTDDANGLVTISGYHIEI